MKPESLSPVAESSGAAASRLPVSPALPRLLAFAVDYGVLVLYLAVLTVAGAVTPRDVVERVFATPTIAQLTVIVFLTVPVLLYFAVLESSARGATVGKRVLRQRVTTVDGRRVGFGRALGRNVLKLVPWELAHTCLWRIEGWPAPTAGPEGWTLVGLIGVWVLVAVYIGAMVVAPRRQTPYDLAARTVVVREANANVRTAAAVVR